MFSPRLAVIAACAFGSLSLAMELYHVTDLGDLPGGRDESFARAINAAGDIVGWSETADGPQAVLWSAGTMTPLQLPTGYTQSIATDINNAGLVVGYFGPSAAQIPARWDGGAAEPLPLLPDTTKGIAYEVNDAGVVVGSVQAGTGLRSSVRWDSAGVTALAGVPTATMSLATHINEAGAICGWVYGSGSYSYRWSAGLTTPIPNLAGITTQQATCLNADGTVVGTAMSGSTSRGWIWDGGTPVELGYGDFPVDTHWLVPRPINDGGLVVGWGPGRAFVWTSATGTRDLNGMLDSSGAGWTLQDAYDVNELGQIVGVGVNPAGATHAFLATPVPEPAAFAAASLLVVSAARRRVPRRA